MRHERPLLICLCLLLILGSSLTPISAQDDSQATTTPTPIVPEFVTTWSEEVIYPQAVRFQARFDRPLDEILLLELTLRPPGQTERTIRVAHVIEQGRTYAIFEYVYQVPVNNPLPFLADVEYEWSVVTSRGENAVLPGVFPYADPETDWIVDNDPGDRLNLIYPDGEINADQLRLSFGPVYDLMAANTNSIRELNLLISTETTPFDPCVENDDRELVVIGPNSGTEVVCSVSVAQGIADELGYTQFEPRDSVPLTLVEGAVRHAYDLNYAPIWAASDVPEWLKKGLLYVYLPGTKSSLIDVVRRESRTNSLYSLSAMNEPDLSNVLKWDGQAYAMTLYIADQVGIPALFDLARVPDDMTFNEHFENIMERPLNALIPNTENWAFSSIAENHAQLNLYQGATPIPSPTQTNTPFPPTETPIPTATGTPTPTETPFGFRFTATPLSSRTPTPTFTPLPPTNTPLPARSFDDLTPQPTPQSQSSSDDDLQGILVPAVGGIFVILGLLILFVLRRSAR